MLTKALIAVAIIVLLFVIVGMSERRRERSLRTWVDQNPDGKLHWPFTVTEHKGFPADDLVSMLIQRPPMSYASAVQMNLPAGEVWFVEYRATPPGRKTTEWFTLIARRYSDERTAGELKARWKRLEPDESVVIHNGWVCRRSKGLLSTELLAATLELQ